MIIGNGLLARSFAPRFAAQQDIVIFASGVSNSLESDAAQFDRESALLHETLSRHDGRLVYFSSCGAGELAASATPYMQHKVRMESVVLASGRGLVLRLPQVVARTDNPHTLTNFIRDRILGEEAFTVWAGAERNLIDIEHIVAIGTRLIEDDQYGPHPVSIASERSLPMLEIVQVFEDTLGRKGRYTVVDKSSPLHIDTAIAKAVAGPLGINLGDGYVRRVIQKYYGARAEGR